MIDKRTYTPFSGSLHWAMGMICFIGVFGGLLVGRTNLTNTHASPGAILSYGIEQAKTFGSIALAESVTESPRVVLDLPDYVNKLFNLGSLKETWVLDNSTLSLTQDPTNNPNWISVVLQPKDERNKAIYLGLQLDSDATIKAARVFCDDSTQWKIDGTTAEINEGHQTTSFNFGKRLSGLVLVGPDAPSKIPEVTLGSVRGMNIFVQALRVITSTFTSLLPSRNPSWLNGSNEQAPTFQDNYGGVSLTFARSSGQASQVRLRGPSSPTVTIRQQSSLADIASQVEALYGDIRFTLPYGSEAYASAAPANRPR